MATKFVSTLPKSLSQQTEKAGRGRPRKFITASLEAQLKKHPKKWAVLKENANATEATRLRKQGAELGITIKFVSKESTDVLSRTGRPYKRVIGDIYATMTESK
jgi:hypothetical protein